MRIVGGRTIFSPSDLVSFAGCRHLTELERAAAVNLIAKPIFNDPAFELLLQRGREHEERYLAELEAAARQFPGSAAQGSPRRVTRIEVDHGQGLIGAQAAARETEVAMKRGDAIIYQATFLHTDGDASWRGHADFLLRVDAPSDLGDWSYEPADAKLARAAKASAVLQLCAYAEMVARTQGRLPEHIRLILGGPGHPEERLRLSDYYSYYRWIKAEFAAAVAREQAQYPPKATYPEPVEKCESCDWSSLCDKRRRDDDHLSLVAGITRNQRVVLDGLGITTVAKLAKLPVPIEKPPLHTSVEALERTREQARLQVESRDAKRIIYELLSELEPDLGLGALPEPSPGDLFFDIEGDPFAFDVGIEYLFGIAEPGKPDGTGAPSAYALWAHDGPTEKKAFEDTVDLITEARRRDPNLHVFHYNHYEPTALRRLMSRYGTREAEVDALLRHGVLVDLYRVVRQGVRAGVESYSIKDLEPLYAFVRMAELREAGAARAEMEAWIELGASGPLAVDVRNKVRVYNFDDCLSAWKLRDWLERRRDELAKQANQAVPRPTPRDASELDELLEKDAAVAALANKLRGTDNSAAALLGNLLDYHRREAKSAWWEFFELCDLSDAQMIENKTCLGGLRLVRRRDPPPKSRSYFYEYEFPHQEHSIEEGMSVFDPRSEEEPEEQTGTAANDSFNEGAPINTSLKKALKENRKGGKKSVGTVFEVDDLNRRLVVKRAIQSGPPPDVTSVVPRKILTTKDLLASLLRVGESVASSGIEGDGPHRVARDLLLRKPPRLNRPSEGPLLNLGETSGSAAIRLVGALDAGVLPIQGPPGSGKTYSGAEMALALVQAGHRVGVTANSHKVISNFVARMCDLAQKAGRKVDIVQGGDEGQVLDHAWVSPKKNSEVPAAIQDSKVQVVAGTAWLWAREDMASTVEALFVDEASQFSLANGVASSPAARSLVLLGDPQQLEQPLKGMHPPGAGASVLGHILGDQKTIPPEQGLFIAQTRRLHPDICAFTSELFYESKLSSVAGLEKQSLRGRVGLDGTGLRVVAVSHAGNQNESAEEVAEVKRIFESLLSGGSWIDSEGSERKLGLDDILVIAPYNAQVAALIEALPQNARVGTVDKFQGQEAPVVIYSMATSTSAEAPRGMPFLYSPNRLNVATSRAKCLAIIVASPELFRVDCKTPAQIKLANAFCRLREVG